MMQSLRSLVRTYCLACLVTGILQQFGPAGNSRKVLQSVTGLYLIAAVLLCGKEVPFSFSGMECPPLPQQETEQSDWMEDALQKRLEAAADQILASHGIPAQAALTLEIFPDGETRVDTICLSGTKDPRAEDVLAVFKPRRILWDTGEAYG